jgi:DNA-binding MarR family transcriptional regulator
MADRDEPRWLDELEMAAWLPLCGTLVVLPTAFDTHMQRMADLNQFEYLVLARLSEAPGHTMRMSHLAGQAHGSLSRLSHLIRRLEQRGWVRREVCTKDGRATNAVLTDDGYAKVVEAAPHQVEIVRRLVIDNLSRAQLRQLRVIAQRMIDTVDSELEFPGSARDAGGCPPDAC